MARMARAAFTMFHSPESWRASASLMSSTSTRDSVLRSSSGLPSIQKFMVSQATSLGRSTWSRTSRWSTGSMLPRKTCSDRR